MPDATRTVSDHLLDRLDAWGVRRLFGFPGDGVNGVMGALNRAGDRFEFVQVAHEELAGLMATAHAKFAGGVGVCISTSGPGAIHLLNGLYDAKLDHQPVVAIVGQQAFAGVGGSAQQETNLRAILQDVASSYLEVVSKPEQLAHVIDRAFRAALGNRTVAAVILPHDVQLEPAIPDPPKKRGHQHSAPGFTPSTPVPPDELLRRAADVINAGRKVAMLVGAGAAHASREVERVAEQVGAGVAKSLLGKAVVPDDLPYVTGSVGWLGTAASNRMMRECDTLLMVGTNFPYTEFLPEPGNARGVQIDVEPRNLALRYPIEVPIIGDAADVLRRLLPMLENNREQSWHAQIEGWARDSWQAAERHAHAPAHPVNPQVVVWELGTRLPDNAILTADSGTSAVWLARCIRIRRGMMSSLSGGLATMGCAIPYALAAKLAHPDRPVFAFIGDGAMQMSGFSALVDVAKEWRKARAAGRPWANQQLVITVLNNRDLNYVTWEQRAMDGDPRYVASQALPDLSYAEFARSLDFDGVRVEQPNDVADAWDRALASDRPFVIDAVVDPSVPTLPPELEPETEDKLAKALAEDPDAEAVLEQLQLQEVGQK
ncbi:MAG TPA: thiamine pyrophosphate-requiring protein [Gemmatimonadaceae bacterium]|nr:thiamine pyrophosphate-requiring protein [Gemmatimonadaceae bacterium]